VTVGTTYYVIASGLTADVFKFATAAGGSAFDITAAGANTVASIAGRTLDIIADSKPFKVGPLAVFPTLDGMWAFEPDSDSVKTRPFGFKSPILYDEDDHLTITVTPSSHQATQVFNIGAVGSGDKFTEASGDLGEEILAEDHQRLDFFTNAGANNVLSHERSLGAAGVDFEEAVFFIMDFSLGYYNIDPNGVMERTGDFVNGPIVSSGWEFAFYRETTCDNEITRFAIPKITSNGAIHRICFHLGDTVYNTPQACTITDTVADIADTAHGLSDDETITFDASVGNNIVAGTTYYIVDDTDPNAFQISATQGGGAITPDDSGTPNWTLNVQGIAILTGPTFATGGTDHTFYLHVYSEGGSGEWDDSWDQKGNWILPAVKSSWSPWNDFIPLNPGTKVADKIYPTSAAVIETSNDAMTNHTPDRPRVKWSYIHRGRSYLSDDEFDQLLSNASATSAEEFPDPWSVFQVDLEFPTNDDSNSILDDYGDYVTHILWHRETYIGLGADEIVTEVGAWAPAAYAGKSIAKKAEACTFAADDTITCTDHGLSPYDGIRFGSATGGVSTGTTYYVMTTPTVDTFKITATRTGTNAVDLSVADNSWTSYLMSFEDTGRVDYPCSLTVSTDIITSASHRLYLGDAIAFGNTAGGVTKGTLYYVITRPTIHTFQVSTTVDGDPHTLANGSNTWTFVGPSLVIGEHTIPELLEENKAYADDSKYAVVVDNRVCGAYLTYDDDNSEWTRPLMMMMSNDGDYASFPVSPRTSSDQVTQASYYDVDGSELGQFSPDSYEIKGLLAKDGIKFVFTERGLWELVGDSASAPWRFLMRDSIGLISAKTLADCRSQIIYHGPADGDDRGSYFYSYSGGRAIPISIDQIDSTLIDWTKAHQGVFSNERYVFFCYYDDPDEESGWCRMVYTLGGAYGPCWTSKHGEEFEYAGMGVDEATGDVYALTHDGDIVNVFGQLDCYGADEAVRTIEQQHIVVSGPHETRKSKQVVADIITEEDSIEIELTVTSHGLGDATPDTQYLEAETGVTQYRWPIGVTGDAVKVKLVYRGDTPPDWHDVRLELHDAVSA
jgi:hypothetical protein